MVEGPFTILDLIVLAELFVKAVCVLFCISDSLIIAQLSKGKFANRN
jgi:hypothetical protein